jgi:hypothetical protein
LVEEVRVGSSSDPDLGFSRIAGLLANADGDVYVVETAAQHIRVYDSEGQLLRIIGGPGEGPGEFSFRTSPRFGLIGDTLWVNDVGAGRFTLFTLDGSVIATIPVAQVVVDALPGVPLTLRTSEYLGGGEFTSLYSIPSGSMRSIATSPQPVRAPVLRLDRTGTVLDTLRLEIVRASSPLGVTVSGQRATVPQPPDERPLMIDRPSSTYVVDRSVPPAGTPAVISVLRRSAASDTVYSQRLVYEPKQWTDERLRAMMEVSLRLWSNRVGPGADTAAAASAIREAMSLPPFQPPVSSIRVGEDEVLWLAREESSSVAPEWIMLSPTGDPIGVASGPLRSTLYSSYGPVVWGTILDDVDVPWLVRFRLTPAN